MMEFHISQAARERYQFEATLFSYSGNVIFANVSACRAFAHRMNTVREVEKHPELAVHAGAQSRLNALMALGPRYWSALRRALSHGLRVGAAEQAQLQSCLVAQAEVEYAVAAQIGDYTDFYTVADNLWQSHRRSEPIGGRQSNFIMLQ